MAEDVLHHEDRAEWLPSLTESLGAASWVQLLDSLSNPSGALHICQIYTFPNHASVEKSSRNRGTMPLFIFEIGSHFVARIGLELNMPLPLGGWD